MARATLQRKNDRKGLVPVRACWGCDAVHDVFHMTLAGKRWHCADCYATRRSTLVTPQSAQPAGAALVDPKRSDRKISKTIAELERVDTILRWVGIALKTAFYFGCMQLAEQQPLIRALMLGVLAGDSIAWVGQAWFDRCFHTLAVSTEAVLYTLVLFATWQCGMFEWPESETAGAVATAALVGTAALKGARFWRKLHIGDD